MLTVKIVSGKLTNRNRIQLGDSYSSGTQNAHKKVGEDVLKLYEALKEVFVTALVAITANVCVATKFGWKV